MQTRDGYPRPAALGRATDSCYPVDASTRSAGRSCGGLLIHEGATISESLGGPVAEDDATPANERIDRAGSRVDFQARFARPPRYRG